MKNKLLSSSLLLLLFLIISACLPAQRTLHPAEGYDTQVGTMVSMLEDLKNRITRNVKNLDQAKTDFLLDEQSNRIGAMILHLAATEKIYQVMTFENRRYNTAEAAFWDTAMGLGDTGRKELINKPIKYYLDKWAEVRAETLRQLKSKDDNWLSSEVSGRNMNNHWAWFHVMEHQANHMGQINMLRKRMN